MATVRSLIQTRLADQIASGDITTLSGVDGAGPLFSEQPAPQPGWAYVGRIEAKARPNEVLGGAVHQEIAETFAVYLCAANAASQAGADSSDDVEAMAAEVSTALLGWRPVTGGDPLSYAGGKLIQQQAAVIVWAEFYSRPGNRNSL